MARSSHLLAAQQVTDPQGTDWMVGIRWLHHRPTWLGWGMHRGDQRKQSEKADWMSALDVPASAEGWVGGLVVLIVVLVVSWWVLIPVLVLVVDILLIGLILLAALAARILFRRPWVVEATSSGTGEEVRWGVAGYRNARRSVGQSVERIGRGLGAAPLESDARPRA